MSTKIKMTRQVVQFQAPDGKVFPTEQQAQRHAEDLLCQALESFLTLACPGMDRPSIHKAVLNLEANQAETGARLSAIIRLLNHADEGEDE